jgi:hypothetical protein
MNSFEYCFSHVPKMKDMALGTGPFPGLPTACVWELDSCACPCASRGQPTPAQAPLAVQAVAGQVIRWELQITSVGGNPRSNV